MLKELIDKFYSEKNIEKEQTRFYITDAGKCSRVIFFKFKKAPRKKLEPRVLRMFDHGDYIHRLILNALFSLGLVRASEIDIPSQEIISGRADAIISVDNKLYVLDIKSMNSMVFEKLEAPKEENVNQLQLYLHYFKIPKGILLYVNKDTQDLKEFLITYNQELVKTLLQDLQKLREKILSDIIPPPLPDWPENWQCRYCPFFDICKMVGQREMSWQEFKAQIEKESEIL